MNNTVFYDADVTDDERRNRLYDGQLFVYSKRQSILDFVAFARSMIENSFKGFDPETAQYDMKVEDYAEILGKLKPEFIHHPESKRHLKNILEDFGCDLEKVYFDVPRMRSSTSDNYLTSGIAYAWHPHRDTWYSAPACQINWWLPIYDIQSENAMAFHPQYWSRGIRNSSSEYNYYVWNKRHRGAHVAQLVGGDPRPVPHAIEEMDMDPQIRLICPVGGIILFSAAQMHSSVPNTSGVTRFSIDFRTIHLDDAESKRGAPNVDSSCTGTVLRDFLNGADLSGVPDKVVALHDDGSLGDGELVYKPH